MTTVNLNGQIIPPPVQVQGFQPPVQEYKRGLTEVLATAYVVEGVVRYCLGRVEQGIEKAYGKRIFGSYWTPMSHELVNHGTFLVKENIRPGLPGIIVGLAALYFII